jgi:hypothetical protein
MRGKRVWRRRLTAALGATLAGGAAVIAMSTPASAAISNNRVQVCAQGTYEADILWADDSYSYMIPQGQCRTFDIVDTGTYYVIAGYDPNRNNHFIVQTVQSGPRGFGPDTPGSKWGAEGTITSHYAVQWQ